MMEGFTIKLPILHIAAKKLQSPLILLAQFELVTSEEKRGYVFTNEHFSHLFQSDIIKIAKISRSKYFDLCRMSDILGFHWVDLRSFFLIYMNWEKEVIHLLIFYPATIRSDSHLFNIRDQILSSHVNLFFYFLYLKKIEVSPIYLTTSLCFHQFRQ